MVVIVAGFGGVRHALLANLVLLLGMAWAFGYATIAVGHLNILSVTFTATLIGVGIDYGTYYVARYLQYRDEGLDPYAAIMRTSAFVGPGIFTGAVTTAIAFFSAAWTNFTGVSELGVIAGGGLILCAFAQLYVLPVCLYLVDSSRWGERCPCRCLWIAASCPSGGSRKRSRSLAWHDAHARHGFAETLVRPQPVELAARGSRKRCLGAQVAYRKWAQRVVRDLDC